MWKPPAPPEAPKDAEQLLLELANYYQELVEYHQKAAKEAYVRLTQVEALIGEPKIMSAESVGLESQIEATNLKHNKSPNLISGTAEIESPENNNFLEFLFDKQHRSTEEDLDKEIEKLLRQNRGKILQIDYIERELGQKNLKERLIKGEKARLWSTVPDAPGCWTLDLKDIAEFAPKSKKKPNRKSKRKKIMPRTGRIREYQSLTQAVADYLEESYPNVRTNQNVVEWLYPKGLSSAKLRPVKESVGKVLSKGEGNLWKRVALGRYVWKGED